MGNGLISYQMEKESILFPMHLLTLENSVKVHCKGGENSNVRMVLPIGDSGIITECMDKGFISLQMEVNMKVINSNILGSFERDLPNGEGMEWYSNGSVYVGTFLDGDKHGTGKMTFVSGEVYEGQFEFDDINGIGVYVIVTVDLSRDGKMEECMKVSGVKER